jgi:hypothetical protein
MRTAVLTATKRYGGLDVTFASLMAQTVPADVWIIADEHQYERMDTVMKMARELIREKGTSVEHFEPLTKTPGYYSNLPAIYNYMARRAIDHGCDLAISLQDYIATPSDGIELFLEAQKDQPGSIVTGLCSMSRTPTAEEVYDPKGLWTVFKDPFTIKTWGGAVDLEWPDVRAGMLPTMEGLIEVSPKVWEMNWSCFPLEVFERGVEFDETYGEHIGHENVQFAWACSLKDDRKVFIQPENHAVSLPHRHYFAEEWEEQQVHRDANQHYHKSLYGGVEFLRTGQR